MQRIRFWGLPLLMMVLIASCNKERTEHQQVQEITIEMIVEQTKQHYLAAEISGGDEQNPFEAVNEGLIDEYLAGESNFENHEKSQKNRLIRCLKSVNLNDEQIPQVRRTLRAYEIRNERIIQKHREEFAQLHERMDAQRNELIRQLNSGEIDRPEFRRKMARLREKFHQGLLRIKESNAEAFSHSFRMLMHQLNLILDEDQWTTFVGCLRS